MFKRLRNAFNAVTGRRALKPQGEEAVEKLGHRNYVGGMWEEIGKLQFDFLVQQGQAFSLFSGHRMRLL
jgi:hypothetical protein